MTTQNSSSQKTLLLALAGLVICGTAFFGGLKYGESKSAVGFGTGNFANLTPEQRAQFMTRGGGNRMSGGMMARAGATNGEILSKDDKSITIKLRDGGSRIVFLSDATEVSTFAATNRDALAAGKSVSVFGASNSDGSVTAQSIQIRPEASFGQGTPIKSGEGTSAATSTPVKAE